ILQTGTTIDNAGLLEATATGTLDRKDTHLNYTHSTLGTTGIVFDPTTTLLVAVPSVKIDGAGKLALQSGNITGQALNHGNELVNFDNAIVGTVTISKLGVDSVAHSFPTRRSSDLILQTGTTIDNAGLLEATATGT